MASYLMRAAGGEKGEKIQKKNDFLRKTRNLRPLILGTDALQSGAWLRRMGDDVGEVSLQGAYVDYLTGDLGWDKLWMEVHKQSTICINRLCKKTGARVPPKEKAELITDTDIRVMERLKKKEHIGNLGGVIYYAASTELGKRGIEFVHASDEVQLQECSRIVAYPCSEPGCTEMLREPGFCRSHSPAPRIEGMALSVQQAADELGISRMGIYRLVLAGKLHIKKVGDRSVISRQEIQSLIT